MIMLDVLLNEQIAKVKEWNELQARITLEGERINE